MKSLSGLIQLPAEAGGGTINMEVRILEGM